MHYFKNNELKKAWFNGKYWRTSNQTIVPTIVIKV